MCYNSGNQFENLNLKHFDECNLITLPLFTLITSHNLIHLLFTFPVPLTHQLEK